MAGPNGEVNVTIWDLGGGDVGGIGGGTPIAPPPSGGGGGGGANTTDVAAVNSVNDDKVEINDANDKVEVGA